MTHTPGPWYIGKVYFNRHEGASLDGNITTVKMPGACEAPVVSLGAPKPEIEANAKLIAAAPDLLDALQDCLQFVVAWRFEYADKPQDKHNNAQRDRIDTALRAAQNAIDKATK